MENKISFLISTNRPYFLFAKRVVDTLYTNSDIKNHEIIICSTDKIIDNRIIFVDDELKLNGPQGFNQAAKKSTGDFLVVLTDDHIPDTNFQIIPQFFKNNYFHGKKFKVATSMSNSPCYTNHGDTPSYLHRILMCRFPIMNRETFNLLGGYIFHPDFNFKSPAFADHFLSIFLFLNGCETIEIPFILRDFQNQIPEFIDKNSDYESLQVLKKLIYNYKPNDNYV